MNRTFTTLGASVVALGTLIGSVEAKTVFYEVNGQRYSYDTSNRRQTAAARKVIEVAKIAETANAKAAAERASNPLVAVFGSQAQREAEAAQAQLNQIVAEQEQAAAATKAQRAAQTATEESSAKSGNGKAENPTRVSEQDQGAAIGIPTAQPVTPDLAASAEATHSDKIPKAAIKSVFLDADTGIKTIIRADGSMHEEPFDPSVLSKLDPESRSAPLSNGPDTGKLAMPAPDGVTGSTSVRGTTFGMNSGAALDRASFAN
ncbi:hypothetical protein [Microvirga sp. VF16]|uniref:hypothetical protein n=1 Tax=Microvirga sp. VF16 TaxID=2807101 RepID=UPI00193D6DD8|nr:hypothetical protein [Microvirga sp. VF16]QRM34289.1 hypothetical protein JO965_34220 [Microvirga sp. VF16]